MSAKPQTVEQYLATVSPEQRAALQAVREVILKNLDDGYAEGIQYGMIGYFVPHSVYPNGYHCDPRQPLPFASLAARKDHMSLGLMSNYGGGKEEEWFRAAWAKTGKKLDMGKACIRFRTLDDLPLEVIGEAVRRVPAGAYIAHYERSIRSMNKRASARASATQPAAQNLTTKARSGKRPAAPRRTPKRAAASRSTRRRP
jgi:hypothetical protein